ncbi:unnamed protein product [Boreogadus saida]
MIHQCPADIPWGHALEGWVLNRASQAPRTRREPYDLTRGRGRGDNQTGPCRQPGEMSGGHRCLSPAAPDTRAHQGGPNSGTRAVPRDTTPTQSPPPRMGVVGAPLARGHTGSLSARRPEHSRHTRREGSHLLSEVVSRGAPGTGKNQLLQCQEGGWSKPNSHRLKDPAWTFNHIGGLRLRPQGWPQLGAEYRYIWPLNSIREADHLMPYSTLVASTPEDTGRCLPQGIIRLSRKLFYHRPTEKRFCVWSRFGYRNGAVTRMGPDRPQFTSAAVGFPLVREGPAEEFLRKHISMLI